MGCIGISRDDFERCTPVEFYEIWRNWAKHDTDKERSSWERTRVLAMCAVQPYIKNKLTAHELLPFPWDEEEKLGQQKEISKEEFYRRFEETKRRNGLK